MAVMADRWATALIGALLLAGPMLIVHLVRPEGFGFGDVKFGLLIGLGLGAVAVLLVLVAYIGASLLHAGMRRAPMPGAVAALRPGAGRRLSGDDDSRALEAHMKRLSRPPCSRRSPSRP